MPYAGLCYSIALRFLLYRIVATIEQVLVRHEESDFLTKTQNVMKQILFACLLGMGALLPAAEAKSNVISIVKKKVDIHLMGNVLYATSQGSDGTITRIEIYDTSMNLLLIQTGSGTYACFIDLSDLNPGQYVAKVVCANTTHTEGFTY